MKEIWKDICGYEGKYQISNLGNVKSLQREVYKKHGELFRVHPERILKPCDYKGKGYPIVALSSGDRVYQSHRVHRLIADHFLGATKKHAVDHIDGDRTNNNISNLRLCTVSQNGANKKKYHKGGFSKYKGVTYCKNRKKYIAQIGARENHKHLGAFTTQEEAALRYNEEATKRFGEFALLNII